MDDSVFDGHRKVKKNLAGPDDIIICMTPLYVLKWRTWVAWWRYGTSYHLAVTWPSSANKNWTHTYVILTLFAVQFTIKIRITMRTRMIHVRKEVRIRIWSIFAP